jgi:hypothetical protein
MASDIVIILGVYSQRETDLMYRRNLEWVKPN